MRYEFKHRCNTVLRPEHIVNHRSCEVCRLLVVPSSLMWRVEYPDGSRTEWRFWRLEFRLISSEAYKALRELRGV